MPFELVFDRWRQRDSDEPPANDTDLRMGPFHGGSVFSCTIDLDLEQEAELRAAIANGAVPVVWVASRDAKPPGIVTVAAQKVPLEARNVFACVHDDTTWGILVILSELDRRVTRPDLYRIVGDDIAREEVDASLKKLARAGLVATVAETPADIGNYETSKLEVTCLGEIALKVTLEFLPPLPATPIGRIMDDLLSLETELPQDTPARKAVHALRERIHRGEI